MPYNFSIKKFESQFILFLFFFSIIKTKVNIQLQVERFFILQEEKRGEVNTMNIRLRTTFTQAK
jgi:hypothetical protein